MTAGSKTRIELLPGRRRRPRSQRETLFYRSSHQGNNILWPPMLLEQELDSKAGRWEGGARKRKVLE
jgi:hypothetical protein